ncbi:MAG TPA: phosphoribosylformylglycinamidine cyclo-ligase [Chloroflexota bacterium]
MSQAYRQAGVDIDAANRALGRVRGLIRSTFGPRVLADVGAFGGLFSAAGYRDPVLVASADGVGTKLKIAFRLDRHDSVGVDLVHHCVNDILTAGAHPLFFLDYVAMGRLVPERLEALVEGMARACRQVGCALLGGETAEMPGLYAEDEYDLAGFIVGVVEREKAVTGRAIVAGDLVWGFASSGLHTNGYSLARKVFADVPLDRVFPEVGRPLGEELLEPHRCYLEVVRPLLDAGLVKGMAHITGGGLIDNIPRTLPDGLGVRLWRGTWRVLPIFDLIAERGGVPEAEMVRIFNMGLGFVVVTAPEHASDVQRVAPEARLVGEVVPCAEGSDRVVLA